MLFKIKILFFIIQLYQAAVTVEISILLICFFCFDLFCPLLDKDISIENLYI